MEVDELAAVVRVQAQQGEGQGLAHVVDGATHPLLALAITPGQTTLPVAISTALRAPTYWPSVPSPQWTTRSIARKPGWCSFHWAKARIGRGALSKKPGLVV